MTTNEAEILPCKVCGKQPKIEHRIVDKQWGGPRLWIIRCSLHNTGFMLLKADAIAKWNAMQSEDESE